MNGICIHHIELMNELYVIIIQLMVYESIIL